MPKVLFIFSGTGCGGNVMTFIEEGKTPPASFKKELVADDEPQRLDVEEDVIRVYLNGCHDPRIGGSILGVGYFSPNLDIVAGKIRECFNEQGLSLPALKAKFGSAISDIRYQGRCLSDHSLDLALLEFSSRKKITDIGLYGFSRGGVTTFACARHLDDLGIPIDLFAEEPVSGNSLAHARMSESEFAKNYDLTKCRNLRFAQVVLGAYSREVGFLHDNYYKLMLPHFPSDCELKAFLVPIKDHNKVNSASKYSFLNFFFRRFGAKEYQYDLSGDNKFFTPKFLRQAFHGDLVDDSLALSPYYKQRVIDSVKEVFQHAIHAYWYKHEIRSFKLSFKKVQTLLALSQFPNDNRLQQEMLQLALADSNHARGFREFIIEFENLNQYVINEKSTADKKEKLRLKLLAYRQAVIAHILAFYQLKSPTLVEKKKFKAHVQLTFKRFSAKLSSDVIRRYSRYLDTFLNLDNNFFHIHLFEKPEGNEEFIYTNRAAAKTHRHVVLSINEVRINNSTLLIDACRRKEKEAVAKLIKQDVDINQIDSMGNSPLSMACWADNHQLVEFLLAHGANLPSIDTKAWKDSAWDKVFFHLCRLKKASTDSLLFHSLLAKADIPTALFILQQAIKLENQQAIDVVLHYVPKTALVSSTLDEHYQQGLKKVLAERADDKELEGISPGTIKLESAALDAASLTKHLFELFDEKDDKSKRALIVKVHKIVSQAFMSAKIEFWAKTVPRPVSQFIRNQHQPNIT